MSHPTRSPSSQATRKQKTVIEAPVRLAKALADAGIASRRAAEGLIAEGRVKVNGQVQSSPAINVTPGKDVLEVRYPRYPAF